MKKISFITSILALTTVFSCDEAKLDKINPNGVTLETFFNNEAELTSGVNSIYAIIQSQQLVAREWFFVHDLRSDEVASGGGQLEAARNQMLTGVHDPGNGLGNALWTNWYRTIHRANVILAKMKDAKVADAVKARVEGEAKFLRGWAYFELATLFGGAPIYTDFVTKVDGSNPRSPQADVYKQALADALVAATNLPATQTGNNLGRATKGAAQMLLARIYLQQADYTNARTELKKIYDSGTYKLADDYYSNFTEEGEFNSESIFEIVFAPSGGSFNWGGDGDGTAVQEESVRSQEYSAYHWRNLVPSSKLANEFENTMKGDTKTDPRFGFSFYKPGDSFNNGANLIEDTKVQGNTTLVNGEAVKLSWKKYSILYKSNPGNAQSGINHRIMRFSDAILLLAECENELGNSAEAVRLINQVRSRKGVEMPELPTANFPTSTKEQVFKAIEHERLVELGGEQVRNADILRWRKAKKLTKEPFSYFSANKHELLPIPQGELDTNAKLKSSDQNPGY